MRRFVRKALIPLAVGAAVLAGVALSGSGAGTAAENGAVAKPAMAASALDIGWA
ncbi:hypothetical protein ACIQF6_08405 [Kitasatospora sp. NPDC092948]|uniref:hypothetical protein n=1 Tax=Kitasatospora sp. NPDC092948 TaxID=3364088 RepID=UPI003825DD71